MNACAQVVEQGRAALPPMEERSVHVTLHAEFRGCPVRVDPGRGSHMLRQTEKGVQSELGRSQGKAVKATSVELFVGVMEVVEGCMDCSLVYMADRRGRDRERKHSWERLDTIYCMRTGGRVEAVKRLSNVRRMPERRASPHSTRAGTAGQAGRQDWAGLGRNGEVASLNPRKAGGPRRTLGARRGEGRGGDGGMVRMNWEAGTRSRPFPTAP